MTGLQAIKVGYDRKTKTYGVTAHVADIGGNAGAYAGEGYLVFDGNTMAVIGSIIAGKTLWTWKPAQKAAVLKFLLEKCGSATLINQSDDGTFFSVAL